MSEQMITALLIERAGYERSGKTDRVRQVDEELARRGYEPPEERTAPPAQTADGAGDDKPRGRGRPRLPRDAEGNIVRE